MVLHTLLRVRNRGYVIPNKLEGLCQKFGIGWRAVPSYTSRDCAVHLDLSSKTTKNVSKKST